MRRFVIKYSIDKELLKNIITVLLIEKQTINKKNIIHELERAIYEYGNSVISLPDHWLSQIDDCDYDEEYIDKYVDKFKKLITCC